MTDEDTPPDYKIALVLRREDGTLKDLVDLSRDIDRELETKTPPDFGPEDKAALHEKLLDVAERMLTEARTTRLH